MRLGISDFGLTDQFEVIDAVGGRASIEQSRTGLSATADEDPEIAAAIDRKARVVMRIIDPLFVVHDDRLRHGVGAMIVIRDHAKQIALIGSSRAAVDKECFLCFGAIDREGGMFRGIGAEASGVFISVGKEWCGRISGIHFAVFADPKKLSQCEPDAAVAGDASRWLVFNNVHADIGMNVGSLVFGLQLGIVATKATEYRRKELIPSGPSSVLH